MLFVFVDSLRSLARIHPFCTNVSLPSGRTSLIVACTSTSGVDERNHKFTAPLPTTVVFVASGAVTKDTAVPAGFGCQSHCHCDALPHSPPVPVFGPKSVGGSALAFAVNELIPAVTGFRSRSAPAGPKYHVRAVVFGTGSDEKLASKPGYGSPALCVPVGDAPAPLSNSTRTCGSWLYAASAASYVGIS